MLWGRKIEIEFYDADNETNKLEISGINDLRIYIEYHSTLGFGADTAEIKIYNLSSKSIESLRASYKRLGIRVYAGYSGTVYSRESFDKSSMKESEEIGDTSPYSTLFVGIVNTMYGRKDFTEHVTTLFCIPKASDWGAKTISVRSKGLTLKSLIEGLVKAAGWYAQDGSSLTRFNAIPDDVLLQSSGSLSLEGSLVNCLDKVTSQYNLIYKLTPTGIDIYEQPKRAIGGTPTETYETRLARTKPDEVIKPFLDDVKTIPTRSLASIDVKVQFNTNYIPGRIMDVVDLLSVDSSVEDKGSGNGATQPFNNGIISYDAGKELLFRNDIYSNFLDFRYYFITSVTHTLDTHGPVWDTSVSGMITVYNYSDPATKVLANVSPQGGVH